ncbi:hypothetical protein [Actinomadura litoris]|uniref:hypothetical protein n=1 Tax=Actinomadura litoris TaxID=2678616 RepID=UPI0035572C29
MRDIVHISKIFRLVRGTQHIRDLLDVLHRDRIALRIHAGARSPLGHHHEQDHPRPHNLNGRSPTTCRAR